MDQSLATARMIFIPSRLVVVIIDTTQIAG